MSTEHMTALLKHTADEETRGAVQQALSQAGLNGTIATLEGKSLPGLVELPWDHVVTFLFEQGKASAEVIRDMVLGALIVKALPGHGQGRAVSNETPTDAAPPVSPADRIAAVHLRQLVQATQELQVKQATGPIQVRLMIGDVWVTFPQASTSGEAPFFALLSPDLDLEVAGGFSGFTCWDAATQRWVPQVADE